MRWSLARSLAGLAALAWIATTNPVSAHHSIAAVYDRSKAIALEGRIVAIEIANPHSVIELETRGPDGAPHRWRLETTSAAGLQRMGVEAGAVRIGDHVRLTGYPAGDGTRAAWLTRIETSAGRVYDFQYRRAGVATPIPTS